MSETFEMVAKTLYGLEEILAGELLSLGANDIQIGRRMVSFTGDKEVLYKANFYCRTALRILKPIYHFKAKDADTVYKEVKKVKWENYMSLDKTFAIDSVIYSEDFNHSKFVAYRTKDAIVDYFMEKDQKRPSVRVNNPDLYINIHISHNDCTLSIDSSGESLHKRGYRVDQTEAPLNEVLAAGMILKTGWKGESNFVDPMCGSGTLLIEAAMIALNIAPGVHRKEFAFEKWIDFDQELFDRIYSQFGLKYHVELSTRPEDSMGSDEDWEMATDALRSALDELQLPYVVNEGDGAFYGPKIDFHLEDSIGRTWQCGTIQLDFQLPLRFNLEYTGADGEKHRPIMIHRVAFGSIERFIGILIEHFAGAFPTWLAPVQVKVLPISDKYMDYANKVLDELNAAGVRAEVDSRAEKIGYKIREAQMQKIPYMLVVGEKEQEADLVSVRSRFAGDEGQKNLETFIADIQKEIADRVKREVVKEDEK